MELTANHQKINIRGLQLWVDMNDKVLPQHYLKHGNYEEYEVELMQQYLKPGGSFLDIGSYVGDHTVFMAKCVGPKGKGVAIEAAPGNYELLEMNLQEHNITHVKPIHAAAMDRHGQLDVFLSPTNHGDHRVFDAKDEAFFRQSRRKSVTVDCMPMDDLGFIPDLVKVDVQGAELHVFAGMEKILSEDITLFCEFWPYGIRKFDGKPMAMLDLLMDHGFMLNEIVEKTKSLRPVKKQELVDRFPSLGYTNLLCTKP